MKKIAIRVITYNQEDVICRALDSLLCQKEWGLYKIVVSDDCSKDRTWEILQTYQIKYPDIISIYRNEHNLGIYGNIAAVLNYLPDADLYGSLAGDDEYCDGYFEAIQKMIIEKKIDTSDAVGIYSDWVFRTLDGKEYVHKQDVVLTGYPLWSLKARGKICGRSLLYSKKVLDGFETVLQGKGLNLTESHFDSQSHLNIKKIFYLPRVTTIYNAGVGISTKLVTRKSDYYTTQVIEKWNYALDNYVHGKYDSHYAQYELIKADFYLSPSISKLIKIFYHYECGKLPQTGNTIRSTVSLFLDLAKYLFSNHNK